MKLFGMSVPLGKCLLALFLLVLTFHLAVTACTSFHEGYQNAGSNINYRMGQGVVLGGGGAAWDMRKMGAGRPIGHATEAPYPIPPKNMAVFDGVRFAPECCPSTYSNSVGCSCSPGNLEAYVAEQRGGNNTKQCGSY
tara:strand:- start:385 stop:798 length:414 start_codon:yes stop_codon:yes gene_type:complete